MCRLQRRSASKSLRCTIWLRLTVLLRVGTFQRAQSPSASARVCRTSCLVRFYTLHGALRSYEILQVSKWKCAFDENESGREGLDGRRAHDFTLLSSIDAHDKCD